MIFKPSSIVSVSQLIKMLTFRETSSSIIQCISFPKWDPVRDRTVKGTWKTIESTPQKLPSDNNRGKVSIPLTPCVNSIGSSGTDRVSGVGLVIRFDGISTTQGVKKHKMSTIRHRRFLLTEGFQYIHEFTSKSWPWGPRTDGSRFEKDEGDLNDRPVRVLSQFDPW